MHKSRGLGCDNLRVAPPRIRHQRTQGIRAADGVLRDQL
jgi:hypothetical protein